MRVEVIKDLEFAVQTEDFARVITTMEKFGGGAQLAARCLTRDLWAEDTNSRAGVGVHS